mmetsp:Transcript_51375/g.76230  ORF Transcript_51375/g.76230 Transcript_51375/m.76230 type:complete len:266 (+) Transcript_51375:1937-2734(+)
MFDFRAVGVRDQREAILRAEHGHDRGHGMLRHIEDTQSRVLRLAVGVLRLGGAAHGSGDIHDANDVARRSTERGRVRWHNLNLDQFAAEALADLWRKRKSLKLLARGVCPLVKQCHFDNWSSRDGQLGLGRSAGTASEGCGELWWPGARPSLLSGSSRCRSLLCARGRVAHSLNGVAVLLQKQGNAFLEGTVWRELVSSERLSRHGVGVVSAQPCFDGGPLEGVSFRTQHGIDHDLRGDWASHCLKQLAVNLFCLLFGSRGAHRC